MGFTIQQNVPPPQAPFVEKNLNLTKVGYDFLIDILRRIAQAIPTASVSTGLVSTGATQATALALTSDWNRVDTVNAGTGVILQNRSVGQVQRVFNNTATALNVYPPVGMAIDAGGANAAYALTAGKIQDFNFWTTTQINSTQFA